MILSIDFTVGVRTGYGVNIAGSVQRESWLNGGGIVG